MDHKLSTRATPTNEGILHYLHQLTRAFALKAGQEMSESRHNMCSGGISYIVLGLCAPLLLFQEACLQMRKQGTVHQVKDIPLLVVLWSKKLNISCTSDNFEMFAHGANHNGSCPFPHSTKITTNLLFYLKEAAIQSETTRLIYKQETQSY